MTTDKRPVNLNLFTMKFPMPAIGSILHRISGFILFFLIPVFLFLLQKSLSSPQGFTEVCLIFANPVLKVIIWAFLAALIYHLLAGIRHLIMDMGIGESLAGARRGTILVFIVAVILIILMGWWIW
jgi:succinate dehydrogenase / fumarate reductase, cytochrome b subunit